MKYIFKNSIQKIIAITLVLATVLGVLSTGGVVTYAYDAQTGMMVSPNKDNFVETFYQPSTSGTHARYFRYGKPPPLHKQRSSCAC